jgi:hypothetical protein
VNLSFEMTTVSIEAAKNLPAAERRRRLITDAADRILSNCAEVPAEVKPDMHTFIGAAMGFIFDAARRQRTETENPAAVLQSHLLLKTEAGSPHDSAARLVLGMFANRYTPPVHLEGDEGSADKTALTFPLHMVVNGMTINTDVIRFEYEDTHRVKYVIQEEV